MSYIADIPYVGWVIPFLLVLGVVVFVHEYGHYIVGKWCGIKADVFSIGFGKELFHWVDKNGMRWRVGALAIGRIRQVSRGYERSFGGARTNWR